MEYGKHTYQQIESFLNGELAGDALAKFEHKLSADPAFAQEVEMHKLTHELIFDQGLLDIKAQLQDIHHQHTTLPKPPKNHNWGMYGVTLLIISLLSISIWFFNKDNKSITQQPKQEKINHTEINPTVNPLPDTDSIKQPPIGSDTIIEETEHTKATLETKHNHTPIINPNPSDIEEEITPVIEETKDEKPDDAIIITEPKPDTKLSTRLEEVDENQKRKNTIKTEESHKLDCSNFIPALEISTIDACWGKQDGEIAILAVSGGKAPYQFSLGENNDYRALSLGNKSNTEAIQSFTALRDDEYQLWVKDANGCEALYSEAIIIDTKECQTSFSIRPVFGEKWKIPLKNTDSSARLLIFNRAGQVVYQLNISNGYPNQWDGNANTGSPLPMGSYSYMLKYADGNVENGEISIIR